MLSITVMLKDGGYNIVKIPPNLIGQLAQVIYEKGFEWVTLKSGPIAVVGFIVAGKQTGERVIILGNKEDFGTDESAQGAERPEAVKGS